MKIVYCLLAFMLIVATISDVYGGKCTFSCLRKAISCKRAKKPFCCEDFKKCGLDCGESDLRCTDKRGSWNKRYYSDYPLSQEEDVALPYY